MEVHAHTHTARKKWTHYFWEFLMLFLAVFCGFLAEYQLEHKIERDRAKELAASFYDELKSDSVALETVKIFRERKYAALKYLQAYFQDSSIINCSNTFTIQLLYGYYTFSPSFFEPGDAILEQLKNSGSLRYFKSSKLQKLTGDLSVAIANLRKRNAFEEVFYRENIWPFLVKYNDMKWYDSIASKSKEFFVTFLKEYEKTGGDVQFHFDNPENFERKPATNLTGVYKTILKGTGDSQYRIYSNLNSKMQEGLREEYHLK
ncbi:MAG: hypothetical protein LH619_10975 [Chitinophagaceae bacterium]|nr:hypothetical protein [Chitinophagaceae bacterium]